MKHLPDIQCKVIPHESHRYNTVGDYIESKYRGGIDRVNFKVSEMNADYEFLVLIHELIEYYLVKRKGIDLEAIDEFDMDFEKNRKKDDNSEAGENKLAPYRAEHLFATKVEHLLAEKLGVKWKDYDKYILSL